MPKIEKKIIVLHPQGLHARPAALFVQIASKFESSITVSKDEECVNGKSIMGILMLGAQRHSEVVLTAEGEDAQQLIDELEQFLVRNE